MLVCGSLHFKLLLLNFAFCQYTLSGKNPKHSVAELVYYVDYNKIDILNPE